jgi:hypothetical protein
MRLCPKCCWRQLQDLLKQKLQMQLSSAPQTSRGPQLQAGFHHLLLQQRVLQLAAACRKRASVLFLQSQQQLQQPLTSAPFKARCKRSAQPQQGQQAKRYHQTCLHQHQQLCSTARPSSSLLLEDLVLFPLQNMQQAAQQQQQQQQQLYLHDRP